MRTKYWTGNYGIELRMSTKDAESVSHSGKCDNDVAILSQKKYIQRQIKALNPEALAKELKEYGAWDENELANHNDNITRILWIAGGDISDGKFD